MRATHMMLAATLALSGCSALKSEADLADSGAAPDTGTPPEDAGVDSGPLDSGPMDAGDPDAGRVWDPDSECPPPWEREIVEIFDEISESRTFTCDNIYRLNGLIYVRGGTLTIERGTWVQGVPVTNPDEIGTGLLVTREARIDARGTAIDPIVFSSASPVGEREPGDWAGVVLFGDAPINTGTAEEGVVFEGLEDLEQNRYGGDQPTHDCGTLRYVRIEFAGARIVSNKELNGLTVAGCGSDTEIDFVQVHRGLDDALEMFGGSADVRHALLSYSGDDVFDWDQGWTGRVQYVSILQRAGADKGIEADNLEESEDAEPRTMPTVYNLSMYGAGEPTLGVVLRYGSHAIIRNAIISNFGGGALDVRDATSVAGTSSDPLTLLVENTLFYNNGPGGSVHFEVEVGGEDDDDGFQEAVFFGDAARNNVFDEDPRFVDPDGASPDLTLGAGSPAGSGGATPPDDGFFDTDATYLGAFDPDGDDWTERWTAYPPN